MLTSTTQLELFAAIEYSCDRILELPNKVNRLPQKFQSSDSLLSPAELSRQLTEVQTKAKNSSGVAKQQQDFL